MRYPEEHKAEIRARIVLAASRAIRRDGLAAVSIPGLMKLVGLTHGGFYVHFKDREELLSEALLFAGEETRSRLLANDALDARSMVETYVSAGHVEHPEVGCVVAALATEGPKQEGKVRKAFAKVARGLIDAIDRRLHPTKRKAPPSDESLALAIRMVGSIVLARAVDDKELAARILRAARDA